MCGFSLPSTIRLSEEIANHLICPQCRQSKLALIDQSDSWLSALAQDESVWYMPAFTEFPIVIAHEYNRLRVMCQDDEPYGILLQLKDTIEVVLKFEMLIACAWADNAAIPNFQQEVSCLLTTPALSLGAWQQIAKKAVDFLRDKQDLAVSGTGAHICELLDILSSSYDSAHSDGLGLIRWRNERIGHGALGFSNDANFQNDFILRLKDLKTLFSRIGHLLAVQHIWMDGQPLSELNVISSNDHSRLTMSIDGDTAFPLEPYIDYLWSEEPPLEIFFFDNQKSLRLSQIQCYASGHRNRKAIPHFSTLREMLQAPAVKADLAITSTNITAEEDRLLSQMALNTKFYEPKHLTSWLREAVARHSKGVFLLSMARGTGKSTFTEKLNRLYDHPLILFSDLDVRTYHISRSQLLLVEDAERAIEDQWSSDYQQARWTRAPHIADLVNDDTSPARALAVFLNQYRQFAETRRGYHRILMVFDGLDEIIDDQLWSIFPTSDMLDNGVYILLTARSSSDDYVYSDTFFARLNERNYEEQITFAADHPENLAFLKNYLNSGELKKISTNDYPVILRLANNRILHLTLICQLLSSGVALPLLQNADQLVEQYLALLFTKYGEKESQRLRVLLAILCTFAEANALTLDELSSIAGESEITLNTLGRIADLSPLLKIERGFAVDGRNYRGENRYHIVNPDIAQTLREQLPECQKIVFAYLEEVFEDIDIAVETDAALLARTAFMAIASALEIKNMFDDDFQEYLKELLLKNWKRIWWSMYMDPDYTVLQQSYRIRVFQACKGLLIEQGTEASWNDAVICLWYLMAMSGRRKNQVVSELCKETCSLISQMYEKQYCLFHWPCFSEYGETPYFDADEGEIIVMFAKRNLEAFRQKRCTWEEMIGIYDNAEIFNTYLEEFSYIFSKTPIPEEKRDAIRRAQLFDILFEMANLCPDEAISQLMKIGIRACHIEHGGVSVAKHMEFEVIANRFLLYLIERHQRLNQQLDESMMTMLIIARLRLAITLGEHHQVEEAKRTADAVRAACKAKGLIPLLIQVVDDREGETVHAFPNPDNEMRRYWTIYKQQIKQEANAQFEKNLIDQIEAMLEALRRRQVSHARECVLLTKKALKCENPSVQKLGLTLMNDSLQTIERREMLDNQCAKDCYDLLLAYCDYRAGTSKWASAEPSVKAELYATAQKIASILISLEEDGLVSINSEGYMGIYSIMEDVAVTSKQLLECLMKQLSIVLSTAQGRWQLDADTDLFEIYVKITNCLLNEKKYDVASAYQDEARKVADRCKVFTSDKVASSYREWSRQLAKEERWKEAVTWYCRAINYPWCASDLGPLPVREHDENMRHLTYLCSHMDEGELVLLKQRHTLSTILWEIYQRKCGPKSNPAVKAEQHQESKLTAFMIREYKQLLIQYREMMQRTPDDSMSWFSADEWTERLEQVCETHRCLTESSE